MYEQVEQAPEQKSQSVANTISQRQSSNAPTSLIVDNRSEAIQMRRLRDLAKNGQKTDQLRVLQKLAVAHSVTQRTSNVKQGFGFVDNRLKDVVQRKPQEIDGNSIKPEENVNERTDTEDNFFPKVTQLKKTSSRTIAFDFIRRAERVDEMFDSTQATNGKTWLAENTPRPNAITVFESEIDANREAYVSFKNKGGTEMNENLEAVRKLANASLTRQQMFVINNGTVTYRRDQSTDSNPMAHPMLIGGDPDVDFAGTLTTLRNNRTGALRMIVNNDSGHFQFNDPETKHARHDIINALTARIPFSDRKTASGKDIRIRVTNAAAETIARA